MKSRTVEQAKNRWPGILQQLGGVNRDHLDNKHRPCPMCGGEDRFRFDDQDGAGTYICNQCGAGSGMDLLMGVTGWDFKVAASEVDRILGVVPESAPNNEESDVERRQRRLKSVAKEARKLTGDDPVSKYLRHRGVREAQALRYHPGLDYYQDGQKVGTYPAMLGLVQSIQGTPLTYHVTYLTEDGQKAPVDQPKKILPPVATITGGAIRFAPAATTLVVAEGIENALAAGAAYKAVPWAALSAHGMETMEIPDAVAEVIIVGDNDLNYRGHRAMYHLANRMAVAGKAVDFWISPNPGHDFLDEMQRQGGAA